MEEFYQESDRRGQEHHTGERRQEKRYPVNGAAEVVLADGSLLFRGRILNISLAGCLIETQVRLRMQPGTRVEMIFRVNNRVFRPAATTRIVRPREGAGFLFENLNERMQEELKDLIHELSKEPIPTCVVSRAAELTNRLP
jgi:c-di-GMP-binding flagellar brake protein YcgR